MAGASLQFRKTSDCQADNNLEKVRVEARRAAQRLLQSQIREIYWL